MVIGGELSEGHARALLGAPTDRAMQDIAEKTIRGRLPVRRVEELVRAARVQDEPREHEQEAKARASSAVVRDLEARLMRRLGSRVEVRDASGHGEIAIAYGSLDELDRILALVGA
jgi:ParB family chromosome partitioning protein